MQEKLSQLIGKKVMVRSNSTKFVEYFFEGILESMPYDNRYGVTIERVGSIAMIRFELDHVNSVRGNEITLESNKEFC